MHGCRVRLRGADRQAENMAVPFTICEESLLRIPEDDLCWLIILKSIKRRKIDSMICLFGDIALTINHARVVTSWWREWKGRRTDDRRSSLSLGKQTLREKIDALAVLAIGTSATTFDSSSSYAFFSFSSLLLLSFSPLFFPSLSLFFASILFLSSQFFSLFFSHPRYPGLLFVYIVDTMPPELCHGCTGCSESESRADWLSIGTTFKREYIIYSIRSRSR